MKKLSYQILILAMATGSIFIRFDFVSAYMQDSENDESVFLAAILDMETDTADWGEVILNDPFALALNQSGQIDWQYQFSVLTADSDFCESLFLTASTSEANYAAPLNNFLSPLATSTSALISWQFTISDPGTWPAGELCDFQFIFRAWQTATTTYDALAGFSDEEVVTGRIASANIPAVRVIVPNGGETWWVGRTHQIVWQATNPNGADSDLQIDLYYSADSGHTWGQIMAGAPNTGWLNWRVPLFLENGTYWVPSPTARIKVVATDPAYPDKIGLDISDEDYCPPIDYALITPAERAWLEAAGLLYDFMGHSPSVSSASPEAANSSSPSSAEIINPNLAAASSTLLVITPTSTGEVLPAAEVLASATSSPAFNSTSTAPIINPSATTTPEINNVLPIAEKSVNEPASGDLLDDQVLLPETASSASMTEPIINSEIIQREFGSSTDSNSSTDSDFSSSSDSDSSSFNNEADPNDSQTPLADRAINGPAEELLAGEN